MQSRSCVARGVVLVYQHATGSQLRCFWGAWDMDCAGTTFCHVRSGGPGQQSGLAVSRIERTSVYEMTDIALLSTSFSHGIH